MDYLVITDSSSYAFDREFIAAANRAYSEDLFSPIQKNSSSNSSSNGMSHSGHGISKAKIRASSTMKMDSGSGNIVILFDNSYSWYRAKEIK